jgi:LysM repeat protein
MDIAQFIRVFRKNILLLIAIPLLLAVVVYYFTRNQSKVYESEAIIYTGITTGYSIESTAQRPTDFFNTSAQFDNLINLFNSRQTIVESAIMLLAQNLSLETYNTQYISRENFEKLNQMVPKRVKDMVVKNGKAGVEREKEDQIKNLEKEIRNLEKEINKKKNRALVELTNGNGNRNDAVAEPQTGINKNDELYSDSPDTGVPQKTHVVQAGETLLSISQKYGISLTKLRELNQFDGQLRVGQRIVISSNEASSGNSYGYSEKVVNLYEEDELLNEVVNMPAVDPNQQAGSASAFDFDLLADSETFTIEKDPIIPRGIREDDFYKTIQNFTNYYNSSDTNFIYGLLHYGQSPHYSITSLKTLQIYRINNSDLVRLIYTSDDPGICQQTLKIIAHVFVQTAQRESN